MQTLAQAGSHNLYAGLVALVKSITPLLASAEDTSAWISCYQLSRLCGTVYADQGGTLTIQFSNDGVNVDYERTISVAASDLANSAWDQMVITPYIRFKYVNGGTQQTVYRFYASGRAIS